MNTRERILRALNWEEPDRIPLTTYDWFLPRGHTERVLREAGVGLISRLPAHRVEHRQVEVITKEYWENGRKRLSETLQTPVGDIWKTFEPESAYDSSAWILHKKKIQRF